MRRSQTGVFHHRLNVGQTSATNAAEQMAIVAMPIQIISCPLSNALKLPRSETIVLGGDMSQMTFLFLPAILCRQEFL